MTALGRPAGNIAVLMLVLALVLPSPVAAHEGHEERDRLTGALSAVLSLPEAPDATCVSAFLDDHALLEAGSRDSLVPASLMKVVTAAATLEVMRPDEVYTTDVVARRDALESITDGVLTGDLYLIGRGDPVLSTPRYVSRYPVPVAYTDVTKLADRVFAALAARGVTRIEGRVVGDESRYPDRERDYTGERLSAGADPIWKNSYVSSNNAGPLSALLLNGGFTSYSGVVSSAGLRLNVRAADPAQHAASVFDDLLEARGMVITRRPQSGVAPPGGERSTMGAVESPPVSEILARMLSRSDNTIAEMVLKEIGRRTLGSDRASAAAAVHRILRDTLGPQADGLTIADGSGLSYSNRLTCAAVAELLRVSGPGSPLVEGLAVAGETGTLRYCSPVRSRDNDSRLNTVKAKTGTLNDVTSVAGTAVAANGEVLTFAMIANAPAIILLGGCNSLRRSLLNAAANYTYGPSPSGPPGHPGDRAALLALFDATGGEDWFNTWRWGSDVPPGRWHGITTDSSGRVTGIDLGGPFGNGLTGSIPEEIGLLTELARLNLSGNDLRGRLPEQVSSLAKLSELRLDGTGLCLPEPHWAIEGIPFPKEDGGSVETCPSFVDTAGNHHQAALDALERRGILDGTGCGPDRLCPDAAIERWAMAVWLVRAIDSRAPPDIERTRFEDVEADAWEAPYIERLAALGITTGCAELPLRFCPDAPVTRGQMASFLVRYLDLDPAPPAGFDDIAGNSHETAIDTLAAAGITKGCRTDTLSYCPSQPVSRAQMASFIARGLGIG